MEIDYGIISDTLDNVANNVTEITITPESQLVVIQDSEMNKIRLKRLIISLVFLGLIVFSIYRLKTKNKK